MGKPEDDKPKRRGRPKKNVEPIKKFKARKRKSDMTDEEIMKDLCGKIREAIGVDYIEKTISSHMNESDAFITKNWKKLGSIVMPFVAGGVAIEGPQSAVSNAFKIGYYLGSLKGKHTEEIINMQRKYPEFKELF